MKNKINTIFYIIFVLILISCEIEEIISPETGYVEYTVVQAEIRSGQIFPAVRFTRTLPLGIPYDIKQAELKDVTAYLIKNEVQVVPLIYSIDGLYKPRYDFYVDEGEVYELYANWEGKFIYGKTIIPHKPVITEVNNNVNPYFFEADILAETNTVYAAIWIVSTSPPAKADDFYSVSTPSENNNNIVSVRTATIPEEYKSAAYAGQRYIKVLAFDQSYRKYFDSRTSGQKINDPYVQGGGTVEWNMQGEKVIGMFIGVTHDLTRNVN
ncbi:MAG: hypothetical protein OQK77_11595 [Psychromonas sp.]|nr:hypothetical protein [Psychromonas sp.]